MDPEPLGTSVVIFGWVGFVVFGRSGGLVLALCLGVPCVCFCGRCDGVVWVGFW